MAEDGSGMMPGSRRRQMLFLIAVYRKLIRPLQDCFRGRYTSLQLWAILILDAAGPMSLGELAAALHLPKQQMSRMAESLVEEGTLFRQEDPRDRRRLLVGLSPQARRTMQEGCMTFDHWAEGLFSTLDDVDRAEFDCALTTLNRIFGKLPFSSPAEGEGLEEKTRPAPSGR